MEVTVRRRQVVSRRDFLRAIPVASAAAGVVGWSDWLTLKASELKQRQRACILLWMQGGPSQFEMWSPKPDHENGGGTAAISTTVPGLELSANLPSVATVMQELCLIRSLTSKEGNHPRASFLMHTGYLPSPTVKYPTLGSLVAKELGDPEFDLPSFVRIGRARSGDAGGLLGTEYDPFQLTDPARPPDNTRVTTATDRFQRRLSLLGRLEDDYAERGARREVADHRKLYDKTAKLITSPKMETFDVSREPKSQRDAYGRSEFGTGCLLARRLIEAGVSCVEVTHGNWDTHDNNMERTKQLSGQVDQPVAALLQDLKQRGLLESTMVVWMGEFGRTPRINPRGGRDHYPRAFSMALAGCGVRGGQVIGKTDASGADVADRPVEVNDLLRTICHGLRIDADRENMSSVGRPIKVVDGGATVQEVYS